MPNAALLEAKCADCALVFWHASLGDFAYGAAILSTDDGRHFVHADALTEPAKRIAAAMTGEGHTVWPVLAALADPVAGRGLTHRIVCPGCRSTALAYWGGAKKGITAIEDATFGAAERLDPRALAQRVAESQKGLP